MCIRDSDPTLRWVSVGFALENAGSEPLPFVWDRFTITMPDGTVAAAVVAAGAPPAEVVPPGGSYSGGANFCYLPADCDAGAFVSGRYVLRYDGAVLHEVDL